MPAGAEERAVRRALARAERAARVVAIGIGPLAAERAASELLVRPGLERIVITGLCGLLAPGFAVGEALVYCEIVGAAGTVAFDAVLSRFVAGRVAGSLSGVRALASETIVTQASEKRTLALRYAAQAVDMETHAFALALHAAGVPIAALRVGSDAATDDLPELDRTLDGSGGVDRFALALAMLRRPVAGARLARNGVRALGALERAIRVLVTANA